MRGLIHLRLPTRRAMNAVMGRQPRRSSLASRRHFSGSLPPPRAPPPPPLTSSAQTGGLHQSKQVMLGAGILLGGSVYLLPTFEMTREGISAAFRYELSAGITKGLELGIGVSGGLLGYGVAEAYLRKLVRSGNNALTASLKIPFVIFSSLIGTMVSFNLSDYIARYASKCAKVVEYSAEGFERDLFGEDATRGPIPSWENQNETLTNVSSSGVSYMDWWRGQFSNDSATKLEEQLEEIEDSRKLLASQKFGDDSSEEETDADVGANISTPTTTKDKEVSLELRMEHANKLAKGLARLRSREQTLKKEMSSLSSDSPLRSEINKQLAELREEKQILKDEALRVADVKLSKLLRSAVTDLVDELSSIRFEQEKLAIKISLLRKKDSSESGKLWRECRRMDARKKALKEMGFQYGEKISTMADRRARWQQVANTDIIRDVSSHTHTSSGTERKN